ncbi:MAG: translation initiation factor IF-2 [Planctomycetota bacterium]|nr:translation initiation factor IF-2 [Planctomycetota bacterium]
MKIRIFTLAKELQLDSKVLIGYCQKVGIHLKDSPLASISEEEKVRVLDFMRTQGGEGSEAARPATASTPTREPARPTGTKVPTLRPTAKAAEREAEVEAKGQPAVETPAVTPPTVPTHGVSAHGAAAPGGTAPAATPRPMESKPSEPRAKPAEPTAIPTPAPRGPSPLRAHRESAVPTERGAGQTTGSAGASAPAKKESSAKGTPDAPVRPAPTKPSDVPVRPSKVVASGKPPVLRAPPKPAPAVDSTAKGTVARQDSEPTAATTAPQTTPEVSTVGTGPDTATTGVATTVASEATVETRDEPKVQGESPADQESTDETTTDSAEEVTDAGDQPEGEPGSESTAEGSGAEGTGSEGSGGDSSTADKGAVAPMRREDYIHASGASRREMVAIGAVSRLAPEGKKPKQRPTLTLPKLAAPPPAPKAAASTTAGSSGPAQKPEMRISRDMLEKTPLHEHIKAHNQDKKKKGDDGPEDFSDDAKKGPSRGASRPMVGAATPVADRKTRAPKRGRARDMEEEAAGSRMRHHRPRPMRRGQKVELKSSAEIEFPITIRGLSEAMGRRANELIGILMKKGQMLTINSYLDEEQALELALDCGVDLHIAREKDVEEELEESASDEGDSGNRIPRPAIVTILGHVDHGKTTLLDKIRSANVAAGEFGGITQHIAAYQVEHNGNKITFLDTPGHAAFAEMRARGANVTDIAILVVAANDGVMPQTIEALNHARAANVPIIVAMNKVDLPDRNEQRVLQDLAAQNLLAAEWGGDTEVVRTSGSTGEGIENLLETIQTIAELNEFSGNPDRQGQGVCLEAFRDEGRGVLVWLVVQDGTLKKGDVILCGEAHGRIRAMYDDKDREVETAGPSTPVKVAGLDLVPGAGDKFYTLTDIDEARQIAELRQQRGRVEQLAQKGRVRTLQEILSQAETGEVQDLPVIIKADTPGSLEAIRSEILKFQHPEVRVNILHDGVGGVNESDIYLASASGAIVLAFHVVAEDRAEALAEREGVEIRQYNIIYEVTDDIKKAMEGLLKPSIVQSRTGRAIVLQTFDVSRFGRVAGCRVLNGQIERSNLIRIIRDQRILNEYKIASLKRGKDDAREVREGLECGIRLDGFDDVKEGDIFEAIKIEEVKRTL